MLQIVTAELKTEGNKDVVIYKIRVGDDTGEWTVSRRFRNFETLHRALRCCLLCPGWRQLFFRLSWGSPTRETNGASCSSGFNSGAMTLNCLSRFV